MSLALTNIRVRLIAWYIVSLGCVHLVLAAFLHHTMSMRLHQELDQRLATYTTCLVELLPQHRHLNLAEVTGEMAELTALGSDLYVRVVNGEGGLIYEAPGSAPALAAALRGAEATPGRPRTASVASLGAWRALRQVVYEDGRLAYVGEVAIPLRGVEQAMARLRFILFVVVPGVLLIASVGAWVVLNRALRPLQEAIQTARAIQAKDFSQRMRVPKTGDEVQALAETFNDMIGRLQGSFDRLRQFISDASHELRTPLAVLKGEIELGLKTQPGSRRSQDILEICASELHRMSRLVDTLLLLSNADSDKIGLQREAVPLRRVMDEMAEQARVLAEPKGIRVEVVNGSRAVVQADEMRLKQLLLNLIDNAVKYTPAGGHIRLVCRSEDGHVELRVEDTGIGIAADDLPRIFDRFYRADASRSRADGGYGLGLAICKWITEAHHGTITAESAPGRGSAFRVTLPRA